MRDYEKEGDTGSGGTSLKHRSRGPANTHGSMTKVVVVHGVDTNWRINGVADCMERVMGRV